MVNLALFKNDVPGIPHYFFAALLIRQQKLATFIHGSEHFFRKEFRPERAPVSLLHQPFIGNFAINKAF